jgi:tRNA (guanine37-N1)-methyltransferase
LCVIIFSPSGVKLNQYIVNYISKFEEIQIICNKNKGFDSRLYNLNSILKISIGDFIINSGDLSSLLLINAIIRLNNDVINSKKLLTESFNKNLLDHFSYVKPIITNQIKIKLNEDTIRYKNSRKFTLFYRPDLFKKDCKNA